MKLKFRHVLIFAVLLIIVVIICWDRDVKISKVIDGNTVELSNGATVKLIGITNTVQGQQQLEKNFKGTKVVLIPDNSNKFNVGKVSKKDKESCKGMTVYAYVKTKKKLCLNSLFLKKGWAQLMEETFLSDSLEAYRRYSHTPESTVTPDPNPVEPINYQEDNIVLPDYVLPADRKHSHWYADGNMNIEMIKEACDFDRPYTRSFAVKLAGRSPGVFNIYQVCEIFDYCYKKWHYVNDPSGQEYVAYASESIYNSLSGDCDDFAVLMASCIIAIGGEASIVTAYRSDSGHAYAEVCVSGANENDLISAIQERFPQYTIDGLHIKEHDGKKWLNLDWQAGYPGGPYWSCNTKDTYTYSAYSNDWHWNPN